MKITISNSICEKIINISNFYSFSKYLTTYMMVVNWWFLRNFFKKSSIKLTYKFYRLMFNSLIRDK